MNNGSPPQVRGKLPPAIWPIAKARITPAGAGKTIYNRMGKIQNKDHPRRCGENLIRSVANALRKGSPPQVRGKQGFVPKHRRRAGITPAGAGKT